MREGYVARTVHIPLKLEAIQAVEVVEMITSLSLSLLYLLALEGI